MVADGAVVRSVIVGHVDGHGAVGTGGAVVGIQAGAEVYAVVKGVDEDLGLGGGALVGERVGVVAVFGEFDAGGAAAGVGGGVERVV